jgi:ABC-type branched-subunit amino acid transport system ATPase component
MLDVEDVTVTFGGVTAVDHASLHADEGTITGIIGPNGAGKTTLFDVVVGLRRPRSGRIVLKGQDITGDTPVQRARKGIARTFQRLEVFGSLTVRENVQVAVELRQRWSRESSGRSKAERTTDILDAMGLLEVADVQADLLSTGLSRMVELGRALAIRPSLLLLDEPGSGLDNREVLVLADLIGDIAAQGTAIVLVEHDVDLVMRMCSRIWVLESGRVIASGTADEVKRDPSVIEAYLGSEPEEVPRHNETPPAASSNGSAAPVSPPAPASPTAPASPPTRIPAPTPLPTPAPSPAPADPPRPAALGGLEIVDVHAGYGNIEVLHGVSLSVRTGEVVALLGPNGAGKTTLLRVASGQLPVTGGSVSFGEAAITTTPPDLLVQRGICTIPEIRGIFPNLSVADNLLMWSFADASDRDEIEQVAFGHFPQLKERRKQLAGTLSGGEQQMLAISRALVTKPKILLLDEISMGLAPRIVTLLYDIVKQLSERDIGILVVEQFAQTALALADRAAVLRSGRIVLTGGPDEVEQRLGDLYLGVDS